MGRPRTPTNVLRLRGTFRPDRHDGAEPQAPTLDKIPRPPKEFGNIARGIWRRTAKRLIALGVLTENDLGALESYCLAYERAIEAEAVIRIDGRTVSTPQGMKRHPELLTAEKARSDMRKYEALFGMSPSDRAKLRVKPKEAAPTADPWAGIANG